MPGAYNGLATVGQLSSTVGLVGAVATAVSFVAMGCVFVLMGSSNKSNKRDKSGKAAATNSVVGIVFSSMACCVVLVAFLHYRLTASSKPYAAVAGAGALFQAFAD